MHRAIDREIDRQTNTQIYIYIYIYRKTATPCRHLDIYPSFFRSIDATLCTTNSRQADRLTPSYTDVKKMTEDEYQSEIQSIVIRHHSGDIIFKPSPCDAGLWNYITSCVPLEPIFITCRLFWRHDGWQISGFLPETIPGTRYRAYNQCLLRLDATRRLDLSLLSIFLRNLTLLDRIPQLCPAMKKKKKWYRKKVENQIKIAVARTQSEMYSICIYIYIYIYIKEKHHPSG